MDYCIHKHLPDKQRFLTCLFHLYALQCSKCFTNKDWNVTVVQLNYFAWLKNDQKKKNSNKLFSYWNGALILKAQKRYKKQITSAQSKCAKGHCMTGHRSFHTKKGHIHKSSWGGNTDDMFPKCHHTILHPVLSLRGHFLSLMRGLKNGQEAFSPRTSKE